MQCSDCAQWQSGHVVYASAVDKNAHLASVHILNCTTHNDVPGRGHTSRLSLASVSSALTTCASTRRAKLPPSSSSTLSTSWIRQATRATRCTRPVVRYAGCSLRQSRLRPHGRLLSRWQPNARCQRHRHRFGKSPSCSLSAPVPADAAAGGTRAVFRTRPPPAAAAAKAHTFYQVASRHLSRMASARKNICSTRCPAVFNSGKTGLPDAGLVRSSVASPSQVLQPFPQTTQICPRGLHFLLPRRHRRDEAQATFVPLPVPAEPPSAPSASPLEPAVPPHASAARLHAFHLYVHVHPCVQPSCASTRSC